MAIKIQSVDEAIEDTGLKILVHGRSGAGKTVLCATAGMSTIFISVESGLLSLKKYLKHNPKYKKLIKVIVIRSKDDLDEVLEWLQGSKKQLADWVDLDSITEIAEQIISIEKKINPDPRKSYPEYMEKMLDTLRGFRDLPGYNVVMTAKQTRQIDPDTERVIYSPLFPGNKLGNEISYLFDEVFALRVEEREDKNGDIETYRILQTQPDPHYDAKDRSGLLDDFEPPNLAKY